MVPASVLSTTISPGALLPPLPPGAAGPLDPPVLVEPVPLEPDGALPPDAGEPVLPAELEPLACEPCLRAGWLQAEAASMQTTADPQTKLRIRACSSR